MKRRTKILSMILIPVLLCSQIPGNKVCGTVAQYFRLNRLAPKLVDVKVFDHPIEGHTMRIRIEARRSQSKKDIGLAFAAAAAVANCSEEKFDLLWIEMDIMYKSKETSHFVATAPCTINAFIHKEISMDRWWEDCVKIL